MTLRTLLRTLVLLFAVLGAAPAAQALRIEDFREFVSFDIAPLFTGGEFGEAPRNTEAIAVRSTGLPSNRYQVWFTGTQDGKGMVFEAEFNLGNTAGSSTLVLKRRFEPRTPGDERGFGRHGEALAYAGPADGGNWLLLSRAPDDDDDWSGVYLFDLSPLSATLNGEKVQADFFLEADPAERVEGMAIDWATLLLGEVLGVDERTLWVVNEDHDEAAYEFELELDSVWPSLMATGDGFETDPLPDPNPWDLEIELPEGIAVFGISEENLLERDLLLLDDGQRGPGRLVQVSEEGTPISVLRLVPPYVNQTIWDPQSVDYVTSLSRQRRLVWLIGDDDGRISVLRAHTPEPGAAALFAAQGLVVSLALRRRRGRRS
jgi:hypothetical protein